LKSGKGDKGQVDDFTTLRLKVLNELIYKQVSNTCFNNVICNCGMMNT
jgi:hypothetical protein